MTDNTEPQEARAPSLVEARDTLGRAMDMAQLIELATRYRITERASDPDRTALNAAAYLAIEHLEALGETLDALQEGAKA